MTLPVGAVYSFMSVEDRTTRFADANAIDRNSHPADVARCAKALARVPPKERSFALADTRAMGHPVLWFTTDAARDTIESGYAAAPRRKRGSKADWYCAYLGLGHRPRGTWLAAMHIPAVIIQSVRHYRPAFCDGADSRWFMVGCSDPRGRLGTSWGQTANLMAVRDNATDVDGAPERVCLKIVMKDCVTPDGEVLRIPFDILGKVGKHWGTEALEDKLAEKIWRDRG